MYFNNVHILIYVLIAIIGMIVGKFIAWCNLRLPENKKILSLEMFSSEINTAKNSYLFMLVLALIYIGLLYKFGIKKDDFFKNLELIKYLILSPMLILTFTIDTKHRIIPNRLTLTIFELGIIITFLYGMSNINMVKEYVFGALAGAAIFGTLALFGRFLAGKEAMGLGDVKFVAAVGLFFGVGSIIEISLLSFIIAALCSIVILIVRLLIIKKQDDYIPLGPFLAISSFACMFIPQGYILETFLLFCQAISNKLF